MTFDDLEKRIKEIEQRCEMKTPGPWRAVESFINQFGTPTIETETGGQLMSFTHYGKMAADALFVAHSTSDIPFLLGQLQKYKLVLSSAKVILERNCKCDEHYAGYKCGTCHCITDIDKMLMDEK